MAAVAASLGVLQRQNGVLVEAVELPVVLLLPRRLLRLADRRTALRRRRPRVLGFAIPIFLLLAIPFAGAIVFPIATAGGTLLARELLGERAG